MKTIVEINSYNFASTGKIMLGIADTARKQGYCVITFNPSGNSQKKGISGNKTIGNIFERQLSSKINYYTGKQGRLNYYGTKKLLRDMDNIKPDIIHFHNLHSNYVNLKMLFDYINAHNIKVVWTLHDCWAFTGHCPYFDIARCEKWKTACHDCAMYKEYPASRTDTSASEYEFKKRLFTGVKSMNIVTPSQWLADLTKQSFLKEYPVQVIFNGINLEKFHSGNSDFRDKYHLNGKFIVLGVAFSWGERKGQDRFEKLAEQLDDRFQIVMVGINEQNVKSEKIICIKKTDNQEQLAEIYSAADVLLNPTREDNFPTVNIEALACGTPVLSYGAGGSAEAFDEKSGMVVSDETVVPVLDKLFYENFKSEDCVNRGEQFEQELKFQEYVKLYDKLLKD